MVHFRPHFGSQQLHVPVASGPREPHVAEGPVCGRALGCGAPWGGRQLGRTRVVARGRGALSVGEAHARAPQRALCAGGGGGLGERRGRLGQPSSLGIAERFQGRGGRYKGPRAPRGWCLALGCARTRNCYYTAARAVPGPCRPGLRSRHPAHG